MLPELKTPIPGPASRHLAQDLRAYESRNVTYVDESWPVFWERAHGVNVWDEDGNRFLDLTSAFGVAGLGHNHPALVTAMRAQSEKLLHGMGDVHPTRLKAQVCRRLAELTFGRWMGEAGKVILANSGFEAVEAALKSARLASGRRGVLAFENAYHGLGYGSLLGGGFAKFREPFADQLVPLTQRLSFPRNAEELERFQADLAKVDAGEIGALLVEPIQGRGGKIVPPAGFLKLLRTWCDAQGVVLIFDEIFTGFNRTGRLFACEEEGVWPDLICVGKALSGGFPISACIGRAELMDTWPESPGEALHTSTYLGNPVGCAMALAALDLHEDEQWRERVRTAGALFGKLLPSLPGVREVRGRGLMWGAEMAEPMGELLSAALQRGLLMLADGPRGEVLSFTPPFVIEEAEIRFAIEQVGELLSEMRS
ncbi:MAG: aspartate aminotransferase family protein [Verrucomicrobiales bacterium]